MKSDYKNIGEYIRLVDIRNVKNQVTTLLGLSINKKFIPSVANTIGTNMTKYKLIRKGQFACGLMQVRRDKKIPVALLSNYEKAIISQAYPVFEIVNKKKLLPEYLMMWMSREEFDRHASFLAVGGIRGNLEWEDFCGMPIPVPELEKQHQIVREYNAIVDRVKQNELLNQNLEEIVQVIYKKWFIEFDYPDKTSNPLINSGYDKFGDIPQGWKVVLIKEVTSKIGSGSTPRGGKSSYKRSGISLIRSMNIYDYNFVSNNLAFIGNKQSKKLDNVELKKGDLLINITGASIARCCMVPPDILPARVNQHVAIIRTIPNLHLSYYLLCALCSTDNKSLLIGISEGGSTREALTKSDIQDYMILLPEKNILKKFDDICNKLFQLKNELASENKILLKTKSLLLATLASKNFNI